MVSYFARYLLVTANGALHSTDRSREAAYGATPGTDTETITAIRDRLPGGDRQLKDFALRREAVEHNMSAADLERAIDALPAPKLTRDARNAADLVDLRRHRDAAYAAGYPATGDKLSTALSVAERQQTAQRNARDAAAILAGMNKPAAPKHRHPEAAAEALAIMADHAAGEVLAEVRHARRELNGVPRRVTVTDEGRKGRRYTMATAPRILPDGGATLKV